MENDKSKNMEAIDLDINIIEDNYRSNTNNNIEEDK